jgi:splicing factor 3B subunit 2
MQTPLVDGGLATPSGMSSVAGGLGLETPELIELRKRKIEADMEGGETPSLYSVLPERQGEKVGAAMMGSAHTYEIPAATASAAAGRGGRPPAPTGQAGIDLGGVELALNPEEVDLMDTDAMQAKAEAALRESQVRNNPGPILQNFINLI